MTSMFTDIQLSSACSRNSEAFDDSERILYFTCKLFNSTSRFFSSIDYDDVDLRFRVFPEKNQEYSSPVYVQARRLELHAHGQSDV
jgi:hypothetical protein